MSRIGIARARRIGALALPGLLGLGLLAGCSGSNAALEKYAGATLTAGQGLGDLKLGETKLGWFVEHVGTGRRALVATDEFAAVEIDFEDAQIAFQFAMSDSLSRELGSEIRSVAGDLKRAIAKHPALADVALTSISVASRGAGGDAFFTGATDRGAHLGDPITKSGAHGEARPGSVRTLAGLYPENPDNRLEYETGILFYYSIGKPGGLDETAIERITIFLPD